MNFNQFVVARGDQAVAGDVLQDVVVDLVLIEAGSLDEKLCVKFEFQQPNASLSNQ